MNVTMTDGRKPTGWRSANVWAPPEDFECNSVKQLLVPAGVFAQVHGADGQLQVRNNYGKWPAAAGEAFGKGQPLWARLPIGSKPGDPLSKAAWIKSNALNRNNTDEVLAS